MATVWWPGTLPCFLSHLEVTFKPLLFLMSVRFPDPPFLVSAIFLTTLSVRRLSLEALGVLLRAFPSAVAAARPSSLSDLRPTAIYGWTVSVGTEAVQCNAEMPCASDHLIVSDIFDRGCTIFAFKTTSDIRSVPIDLLNVPCAQCDRIVPMSHVRPSQNSMTMGSDSDLRPNREVTMSIRDSSRVEFCRQYPSWSLAPRLVTLPRIVLQWTLISDAEANYEGGVLSWCWDMCKRPNRESGVAA
ncbi:hypothetical protein EDB85DRAFT_1885421 [Lactarius pseudohatsudake]|nr:hypothetical protein EDB85DRAFT_1885421 [Lactarius pseudohatsudake]